MPERAKGGIMERTVDELLSKAEEPNREAMRLHPFFRGKIEVVPKCVVRSFDDFAIWYTPGVAQPCKEIRQNPLKVYEYTNKWNSIAIVTDGSRVLGLGDIGPEAGLPVMEGKALLYKYLGGVDAFPLCLDTKDPDEIIRVVKCIKPSFGGINLEDISHPKCFYILDTLRQEMDIPVWHDDQQGTATIVLAGLINALKVVGKGVGEVRVTMVGAGAANICTARLFIKAGVDPKKIIMVDSKGVLHRERRELQEKYKEKWEMCLTTNAEGRVGGIREAIEGTDVCVAMSTPGPGTIKKEWVAEMAKDAVLFACANPVPEIWPWEAKEAGARIVATGRSDFPNQINNSLGFPGIFRGTLDTGAKTITDEMCLAAAQELARCAEDKGISEEYIAPSMEEWEVFAREAVAVGMTAIAQEIARWPLAQDELFKRAFSCIERARRETKILMEQKIIPQP
jgi:malate dehydrogenase (oxaloacetate-decarboxylating)